MVVRDENDLSVGGTVRLVRVAVERECKDFGGAAGGGRDGDVPHGVVREVRVKLGDIGDPPAVRRPTGSGVRARIGGDLREMSFLLMGVGAYDRNVDGIGSVLVGMGTYTA